MGRKAYPTHVVSFVCDSCGTRVNLPVVWDYFADKLGTRAAPHCGSCRVTGGMRFDAELYQPSLSDDMEVEREHNIASYLEADWRKTREEARQKYDEKWLKYLEKECKKGKVFKVPGWSGAEPPDAQTVMASAKSTLKPLPDQKVSIEKRLTFLQMIAREWEERREKRAKLRPEPKSRLAPLFRIVNFPDVRTWWELVKRNEEYWELQDGHVYLELPTGGPVTEGMRSEAMRIMSITGIENAARRTSGLLYGWTFTASGPQRLDEDDLIFTLNDWYNTPRRAGSWELRNLEHVLSHSAIETLSTHGGKALSVEDWQTLCRYLSPADASAPRLRLSPEEIAYNQAAEAATLELLEQLRASLAELNRPLREAAERNLGLDESPVGSKRKKPSYVNWWEHGKAELERLMRRYGASPGQRATWTASPA